MFLLSAQSIDSLDGVHSEVQLLSEILHKLKIELFFLLRLHAVRGEALLYHEEGQLVYFHDYAHIFFAGRIDAVFKLPARLRIKFRFSEICEVHHAGDLY